MKYASRICFKVTNPGNFGEKCELKTLPLLVILKRSWNIYLKIFLFNHIPLKKIKIIDNKYMLRIKLFYVHIFSEL